MPASILARTPLIGAVVALLYAIALAVVIAWTQTQLDYRFDVLGYIGAALQLSGFDAAGLHAEAYRQVRAAVPATLYNQMVTVDAYHADVAANANHFVQQLPFYQIRPLYNALLAVLHALGLNLVHATMLVTAAAYAVIGALLFVWFTRHLGAVYGAAAAWLLAVSAPLTQAARAGTVDLLSAALVFAALYALIEHKRVRVFAGLLLLSLLTRSDNIFLVAMFAVYFAVAAPIALRPPRIHVVSFALAASALIAVIHAAAGYYGWPTLFYHTFVTPLPAPAETIVSITPRAYWHAVDWRLGSTFNTAMPFFVALSMIAIPLTRLAPVQDTDAVQHARLLRGVVWIMLANIAVRMAAFPVVWDRQFIAHYLISAALLVTAATRMGAIRSGAATLIPLAGKRRRPPQQKAM